MYESAHQHLHIAGISILEGLTFTKTHSFTKSHHSFVAPPPRFSSLKLLSPVTVLKAAGLVDPKIPVIPIRLLLALERGLSLFLSTSFLFYPNLFCSFTHPLNYSLLQHCRKTADRSLMDPQTDKALGRVKNAS